MSQSIRSFAAAQMVRALLLSTLLAVLCVVVKGAIAHELRPAIADVTVNQDTVSLEIELALEALVAEIDVSEIEDTDEAPNAKRYDELRALAPADLEAALREAWPRLAGNFLIVAGDAALTADIAEVEIPAVGEIALVRDTVLTLSAALPDDGTDVRFGWTANNGPLVVRQASEDDNAYAALLQGGELSIPLPRQGGGGLLRFLFGD